MVSDNICFIQFSKAVGIKIFCRSSTLVSSVKEKSYNRNRLGGILTLRTLPVNIPLYTVPYMLQYTKTKKNM